MDYVGLKAEIVNDPLGLGYSGKTDQQVADIINTVPANPETGRKANREIVNAYEVAEAIVPSEWAAASAQEKDRVKLYLSMGQLNLKGTNTRAAFAAAFGAGTTTRTNLVALQDKPISRGDFLGFGFVASWDVARARAL